MNEVVLIWILLRVGQIPSPHVPIPPSPPVEANAAKPVPASPAPEKRPDLNLLGKTNTESGEARRNENVQFNQIDNNAQKELNTRMGTSATIVTEFRPERNYYGSEFGAPLPSIPHLTALRAQPALHGSIYATHGNSAFSARSFFQVGDVMPARDNQYGVNLGVSLWKGAFLSTDLSQQKVSGYVNGNILIPLDSERTPRVTDAAGYALIQKFIHAYPAISPNRTDIDRRALNLNSRQQIDTSSTSAQLDQKLSAKSRLSARHTFTSQHIDAFQLVAGQNPITTTRSHSARLGLAHSYTPRSQADFTLGFDRNTTQLVPEPNAVGPQVQIGTAFEKLGPGSNVPLDRAYNRFRGAALLQHRTGNHAFTFSGDLTRAQFNTYEVSSNRGNYYFRNDFGRDAITNFLEGRVSRFSYAFGDPQRYHRAWEANFSAGDVWRVRPNLTLSYAVRYTPIPAPHEKTNLDVIPYSCDCNNVGPRFGFAYRLPKSYGVIRSAWGLHFGDIFPTTLQQTRWNLPNFLKGELTAPNLVNPTANVVISPTARSTFSTYRDGLQAPYTNHYNFSWEGTLKGNWRLQTGYVGSRSRKLLMLWHLNRARQVAGIPQTTNTVQDRRPDPTYFDYRVVENGANAYFDAGRVSVIAPNFHGFTMDSSYWFSKAIDTGATYLNTAAGDDSRQGYSQTPFEVAKDLKGPSIFDQRHAFLLRMNYASPRLRRFRWLGEWNWNAVFLAKTGMPFTVITGSDGPGSGNVDGVNGDRPNLVDVSLLGLAVNRPEVTLPRAAFSTIAPTELAGNLGVSTFRRGGIRNLNTSLGRSWTVVREMKLHFRAESINFLNTPQFAEPNPDLSSPAFGKITNTLNDGRTFRLQLRLQF